MTARRPTELKVRLGTARRDRMVTTASPTISAATMADAPAHLGDHGIALWRQLLIEAPWLGRSDLPLLTQLCELDDEREQLRQLLARDGRVLVSPNSGYCYPHPAQSMLRTLGSERIKLLSLCGLSPSDRTRIGVQVVKQRTKLEEMRERLQGNGPG